MTGRTESASTRSDIARLHRARPSSAIPAVRSDIGHSETSAPSDHRPASCSSRRDRRADEYTAPCRSIRADNPPPRGPRETTFADGSTTWNIAFLVVADAGVDDDAARAGVHHQRMHAHDQLALLGHEVRLQPLDVATRFRRRIRQDELGSAGHFQFDDCALSSRRRSATGSSSRSSLETLQHRETSERWQVRLPLQHAVA